jgi:hypothetical protein
MAAIISTKEGQQQRDLEQTVATAPTVVNLLRAAMPSLALPTQNKELIWINAKQEARLILPTELDLMQLPVPFQTRLHDWLQKVVYNPETHTPYLVQCPNDQGVQGYASGIVQLVKKKKMKEEDAEKVRVLLEEATERLWAFIHLQDTERRMFIFIPYEQEARFVPMANLDQVLASRCSATRESIRSSLDKHDNVDNRISYVVEYANTAYEIGQLDLESL